MFLLQDQSKTYTFRLAKKTSFAQESFYLQGIFNYINQRNTSFCDNKHKHMLQKNGAPPDKFGVLYCLLHIEFHGFNGRIDVLGL